jgi:hypothetical protein
LKGWIVSVETDEAERRFWKELEYRVSREMQTPSLKRLFLWCDGFAPKRYFLDEMPVRIVGNAWIGEVGSSGQEEWQFTLSLPVKTSSGTDVHWTASLPPSELAGWLFIIPAKKELEMKLG